MKQTRQPVRAVKQSIYLDVYDVNAEPRGLNCFAVAECRHGDECRYAECRHDDECRQSECRHAECRGAANNLRFKYINKNA